VDLGHFEQRESGFAGKGSGGLVDDALVVSKGLAALIFIAIELGVCVGRPCAGGGGEKTVESREAEFQVDAHRKFEGLGFAEDRLVQFDGATHLMGIAVALLVAGVGLVDAIEVTLLARGVLGSTVTKPFSSTVMPPAANAANTINVRLCIIMPLPPSVRRP